MSILTVVTAMGPTIPGWVNRLSSHLSMTRLLSILAALFGLLVSTQPMVAQSWSIRSIAHEGSGTNDAYDGFPYSLHSPPYDITSFNSRICQLPDACYQDHQGNIGYACSIGVSEYYWGLIYYSGNFSAPNQSYFDFQNHTVGKILATSSRNPRDGTTYPFIMYFASQNVGCRHSGWGAAYSWDGYNFVEGPQTAMLPDCDTSPCYNNNWYCQNGWPCDSQYPKSWRTSGEIGI